MRQRIPALLLLCLFSACVPLFGIPYVAGQYTVDVVVRNSTMALVPDAKVSCWLDGKNIRIAAKAAGYISKSASIAVGAATYYKYDFTLGDAEKVLYAVDLNGVIIRSAYFEPGQYGVAGNEYGITVYIPTQAWPRPALKRVDIFDQVWGGPWKLSSKFEKVDEFFKVKLTMSRKAIEWTGRNLLVVFDTSKKVSPNQTRQWFRTLNQLERNPRAPVGLAAGMAEFLAGAICEADTDGCGPLPESLKAFYSQASKFAKLHRDSPEN